ncbi:FeoB-associated Cys-rich membrane protein [Caldisalinibacter kiritimatiensis]|uniref:FeoB-associated Cys-rich membrane protein n=1 Tax=Caldisalinibacter kiritimatiensis TaxID=1304284 RepID=R1CCW0_9FIRM|nr:FeoB-associated Cys-rich membrane protein [Caldisalinibacter kiritimatiensis]EOD00130.1 hypothetical protein L21TH_1781 [Caldisalinibacter kiritimatiensis]
MINYLIGGVIIGTALYIVFKNINKFVKGETSCSGCSGSCSTCAISHNNRNDAK